MIRLSLWLLTTLTIIAGLGGVQIADAQTVGMEIPGGPPDRLARMMRDEITKWSPIVQRTGVRLD